MYYYITILLKDNKQKKNMLKINKDTKIIPRIEGQMTDMSVNVGCSCDNLVRITVEFFTDMEQLSDLNDIHNAANEVVFHLKMPHYHYQYQNYMKSGEVVLNKSDFENILDFNHY